jgi:hypothetical protein
VANLTVIPGFCFSNTDWVSGIIWPVISGLDTTATVTVPAAPLLPRLLALLPLPEPPPLEHGAAAVTTAAAQAAAASLRFLNLVNLVPNLDELIDRTSAMLI